MKQTDCLDRTAIAKMPKIDLHRHLEGAIRLETLYEYAARINLGITSISDLSSAVQIQKNDPLSHVNLLSKFAFLRKFYQSQEFIQRITHECIEDALADHIQYLELRFSPAALVGNAHFQYEDVIHWVLENMTRAAAKTELRVRAIVSVNRHEPVEKAESILSAALQFKSEGLVGVDLAGNEADYSALPFIKFFERAKQEGLFVTIHAGEWGCAENIRQAIECLYADRIGHGVRILEDQDVLNLAKQRKIPFEISLSSNYHSGVVASLEAHPIKRMLSCGLNVTLNTDDPSISGISLSDEFSILINRIGVPISQMDTFLQNSVNASFIAYPEKQQLSLSFAESLSQWRSEFLL
jgi:adenosine deaminase